MAEPALKKITILLAEDHVVTYSEQVAPILQRHCQECHRPGQVAPFSLLTTNKLENELL